MGEELDMRMDIEGVSPQLKDGCTERFASTNAPWLEKTSIEKLEGVLEQGLDRIRQTLDESDRGRVGGDSGERRRLYKRLRQNSRVSLADVAYICDCLSLEIDKVFPLEQVGFNGGSPESRKVPGVKARTADLASELVEEVMDSYASLFEGLDPMNDGDLDEMFARLLPYMSQKHRNLVRSLSAF